jgi:hypothetical protein
MDQRYNIVDEWLVNNGLGLSMPKAVIGSFDLTAEEYGQFLTYINMRDPDTGWNMLDEVKNLMRDPEFKAMKRFKGEQLEAIKRILSIRTSNARKMMLAKYPYIQTAIDNLEKKIKQTGKR